MCHRSLESRLSCSIPVHWSPETLFHYAVSPEIEKTPTTKENQAFMITYTPELRQSSGDFMS